MRNVTWKRKKRTSKGNEWLLSHLNGKIQDTLCLYLRIFSAICCAAFTFFISLLLSTAYEANLLISANKLKIYSWKTITWWNCRKNTGQRYVNCYIVFITPAGENFFCSHPLLLYNKYHICIRASDHDMSGIISLIFHHFSIRSRRWPRNPREGVYNTLRLNPNSVRSSQQSEVVWRSWRGMKRSWRKS